MIDTNAIILAGFFALGILALTYFLERRR